MSASLLAGFQPLAAIATTPAAVRQLQPLCQQSGATLWLPASLAVEVADVVAVQPYSGPLREQIAQLWTTQRGLIFALATGAVVRLIAPLLQHKSQDPAVVVLDETGHHVISLCSGHQGGADQLTRLVASLCGATPVLTGSATAANRPGIDVLGRPFGWQQGEGDWTSISSLLAQAAPVAVMQDAGSALWQAHLPVGHSLLLTPDPEVTPQGRVWISAQAQPAVDTEPMIPQVQWYPRVLWLGIGCERGSSRTLIATAIHRACQVGGLAEAAIAGVATLDLKADEAGLVELCQQHHWPLHCLSAAELRAMPVPHPSSVVAAAVGTSSVAEAAALTLAQRYSSHEFNLTDGLRVSKQIIRLPDEPGAVTVAIAQAQQEWIGRQGQLWLVGTGPGPLEQMTPAAQTAIVGADAVIGYALYVDLLRSRLRPGQIVESFPITQERQRAERAIELARWGLTVAVVSSGDAGIYGMAGLVMETLQTQDWDGQSPAVQVFPGVTALQAVAARVGSPLMHDFCAVSLSDRLTPWPLIEQRLMAAAQADFVTALYNPRSQTRTTQLEQAQAIFLQHRSPDTPVAIVRAAYRMDEQVTLTTLEKLLTHTVDMFSTVLIGNSRTQQYQHWLITPRGYYDS